MAQRSFSSPIPNLAEVPAHMFHAARRWELIGLKWRNLAERRHAHYLDLYKSGRWKLYYSEEQFRAELGSAIELAQRWAAIAPQPEEREPATEPVAQPEPAVQVEQAKAA